MTKKDNVTVLPPQPPEANEGRKVLVFEGERVNHCFYDHDEPGNRGIRLATQRSTRTDVLLFLKDSQAVRLASWILKTRDKVGDRLQLLEELTERCNTLQCRLIPHGGQAGRKYVNIMDTDPLFEILEKIKTLDETQ